MDLNRRSFIRQAACAALGTTSIASTVWNLRAINAAFAQTTSSDYKALVCLFLYGGNDANNLIIPRDSENYNAYAAARGILAIPQANLLPITPATASADGRQYGLHPNVPELQTLFGNGRVAFLANVGTLVAPMTRAQYFSGGVVRPPQLFSHADQQVEWQTSWCDAPPRTGWGGRMADLLVSMNGSSQVSMSISLAGTNTFQVGNNVFAYQVGTGGPMGLSNTTGASNNPLRIQALQNILNLPSQNLFESEFAKVTNRALANYQLLNGMLGAQPAMTTVFPAGSNLANQLKMIARLIALRDQIGVKRQIFFCSIGGFDTHSDQLNGQKNLFTDLSQSLNAFYNATEELQVQNAVTTFTASDFGRTFSTNGVASNSGSDHGWGSHHLVMGGAVKGGDLYGTVPQLVVNGPDDTGYGRWIPSTSVDEYSATLASWFGVQAGDLSTVLPNIGRFGRPDLGFMKPLT